MRTPDPKTKANERRDAEAPPRSRWRRVAWLLGGIVVLVLGGLVAIWMLLPRFDLGPLAAGRASAALGRTVTFGSLHVTPGRWLRVVLSDAKVANLPGGTRESMIEVPSVTAEIEARSLVSGPLLVRHLSVDGLDVLLEHVESKGANWRFKPADAGPPKARPWLPTMLDARVVGEVVVRTSRGHVVTTQLDGLTINTEGVDQPVKLAGPGSYKGVPIVLDALLGSFAAYRDAATPFKTDITLKSGDTNLHFDGTMTAPLDVDGAAGRMNLVAPTLSALARIAGVEGGAGPELYLDGDLAHDGATWRLTDATGSVGEASFEAGLLSLVEGKAEENRPDAVSVAATFDQLDLDRVLGGRGNRSTADMSLRIGKEAETIVDAKLQAKAVTYAGLKLTDVSLSASQQPGVVAIDALALSYLGGKIEAKGKIEAAAEGGRVSGDLVIAGLEVQALRGVLDMGRLPLTGRVDGHATLQAVGATLNQAARGARVSVVATMAGGTIAREIVELASTDARTLFRTARGASSIGCAIGIMDVRGSVGTIAPLRVRTSDGTIVGRGTVDFARHRADVTVMSESRTTSSFALDVPVRIAGPFADVSATPARLSAAGRAQIAAEDEPARLPPALQAVARQSPCLARR